MTITPLRHTESWYSDGSWKDYDNQIKNQLIAGTEHLYRIGGMYIY